MKTVSKIQALSSLLDDLSGFRDLLKNISFDMECRVMELKELQVNYDRQKHLHGLLKDSLESLNELEFYLESYI